MRGLLTSKVVLGFALLTGFLPIGKTSAIASETAEEARLLAGAEERIEKHRKGDVEVTVVDADGEPVAGATVEVRLARHAFLFGCNIFAWDKIADEDVQAAYRRQFAALFNYATFPYYWGSYEPVQGEPQHERYLTVARWCAEHGIETKGHPLAWNYADPRWLPEQPREIYRLQLARIDDCVGRMQPWISRWDVVNEVTHFDREEFVRRAPKMTDMWQKVGQIEFTKACFRQARQANPDAELLINDYRLDPAYERVIEQLVDDQGRPLYDVIGMQSHMHTGAWTNLRLWSACERFARFGVPLHFTETTILSGEQVGNKDRGEPWPTTPAGEARQAEEVVRCYTMLFSHPAVEAITWWDFCDHNAWKGAPAGFLRADGSPKPAYERLKACIHEKWSTHEKLTTGDDGKAQFRGFLGEYEILVDDGRTGPARVTQKLAKEGDGRWQVILTHPAVEKSP